MGSEMCIRDRSALSASPIFCEIDRAGLRNDRSRARRTKTFDTSYIEVILWETLSEGVCPVWYLYLSLAASSQDHIGHRDSAQNEVHGGRLSVVCRVLFGVQTDI